MEVAQRETAPRPSPRAPATPTPRAPTTPTPGAQTTPTPTPTPTPGAQNKHTPGAQTKPTPRSKTKPKPSKGPPRAKAKPGAQATPSTASPRAPDSPALPPDDGTAIHVSGFPYCTQPQDLVRALSAYGPLRVERMTALYAVLTCGSAELAAAAVRDRHVVYGTPLKVKPYLPRLDKKTQQPKREFTLSKQKEMIVQPQSLQLEGEFYNQLDEVLARVRLTQQEVLSIATLYNDLEKTLGQLWPGCVCTPFGSITTGLGVKTSDADCFVDIPPRYRHPNVNYVNKAKRLMAQQPETYAELLAIPRANTPIVKLHHVPTNTNCDVSFKTPLGARNSRLIAFLLHARPQLLPTAVAIKYWAAVNEVTGSGRLSNYALTLLFVAYLQVRRIIPAVAWLQRDKSQDFMVDYWNTGFTAARELIPAGENWPIADLLGGFFQYYADFDFATLVVCPFLGRPIEREAFKVPLGLPLEFELYKRNVTKELTYPLRYVTSIVVQDPFEQCHNVASKVGERSADDIKEYFKFAAAAYKTEKANEFRGFLKKILLDKPENIKRRAHPEFRINLFPKLIAPAKDEDWKARVREAAFCIFGDILKLNLEKVEEKRSADLKKEKEKYFTTMDRAVWRRKQFDKIYQFMELSFLEKETRITEEILLVDQVEIALRFQVILTFEVKALCATVSVQLCSGNVEMFKDFGRFFTFIMHGWITALLRRPAPSNVLDKGPEPENVEAEDNTDDSSNEDDEFSKKSGDLKVGELREALVDCLAPPLSLKSESESEG